MTRRPPRFEGANETTHSMKTIKTSLAGLFVGMTALWLLAEAPALQAAHGFFPWRRLLVQYTDLLAMGAMSARNRRRWETIPSRFDVARASEAARC